MSESESSISSSRNLGEGSRIIHPRSNPLINTSHIVSSPATSFQRRTVESARQFRDNISNVFREIQPLMQTARNVNAGMQNISISTFLNRSPQSEQSRQNIAQDNTAAYVINIDDSDSSEQDLRSSDRLHARAADILNTQNAQPQPTILENNIDSNALLEAQQVFRVILKYVPFVLILLAKGIYDYHEGIFIILLMFTSFAHANSTVKKEAVKRHRRSFYSLIAELLYIATCLLFIHFIFDDDLHNFSDVLNLVLIRTFTHPLTVWNLLWIVTITDFVLKLITVSSKILLTMVPGKILAYPKRGKIYLFIEALSQLYRSMATVQPWLYYLLESYQGPEKIVAVFLSAFYMISKGPDLMTKLTLLKTAFFKLLQNVAVGSSPTKEQIITAGEHCPICHDEYDSPVLLQCRHIFCENCVTTWFDREQTCPLCRAKIVDDPSWRDGSTTYFVQIF